MSDATSTRPKDAKAPVNIYTSPEFLDVIAKVYFPAQHCVPRDYNVAGRMFRLLTVDGHPPVLNQTFVDMHEPVSVHPKTPRMPSLPRLAGVSHGIVSLDDFKHDPAWNHWMGAPTILWDRFPAWSDYLKLLTERRVLAEDQRRFRRLQDVLGPVEFTVDDQANDVLPTCYAWKSARDRALERTDLFASAANRRFFSELRSQGLLHASTLRAGGTLLAIWLGAMYQGRWTGWVFAFNPASSLNKYSLGRQLLYPMLEHSHRAGHREFDFSIGMEPYKLQFATHVRPIGTIGEHSVASVMSQLLKKQPWVHQQARTLRGWLARQPAVHHLQKAFDLLIIRNEVSLLVPHADPHGGAMTQLDHSDRATSAGNDIERRSL